MTKGVQRGGDELNKGDRETHGSITRVYIPRPLSAGRRGRSGQAPAMIVSQNARTAEDERVGRARLKQNTDTKGSSSRPRSPAGSDADGYMAEDEEHPYDLSAPDGNGDDTTVLNGSYDDVYDDDKAWEDLTGQS